MRYKLLSTRDAFSGVLNKRACEEAMVNYLRACAPKVKCAFIIIDLDDFKQINDTRGHLAGDEILRRTGEALQELFRASDIIGRFGGDEFVILAKGMSSRESVERKCRRIRERVQGFAVNGEAMGVTCSLGAVLVNDQNADHDAIFRQADARPLRGQGARQGCLRAAGDTKNTRVVQIHSKAAFFRMGGRRLCMPRAYQRTMSPGR